MAFLESGRQFRAAWMIGGKVTANVSGRRDERFVAVLLEEHPLQHLRTPELRRRYESRAFREVPQDGVRFGQVRAIVELERGDAPVRIALEEFRRACQALVDVDVGPSILHAELREQQADLEAVAGV